MFYIVIKKKTNRTYLLKSSIYLNVLTKTDVLKTDFLNLKKSSPGQFLGASSRAESLNFKILVATSKQEVCEQNWRGLLQHLHFERNYDALNSKSSCSLSKKI